MSLTNLNVFVANSQSHLYAETLLFHWKKGARLLSWFNNQMVNSLFTLEFSTVNIRSHYIGKYVLRLLSSRSEVIHLSGFVTSVVNTPGICTKFTSALCPFLNILKSYGAKTFWFRFLGPYHFLKTKTFSARSPRLFFTTEISPATLRDDFSAEQWVLCCMWLAFLPIYRKGKLICHPSSLISDRRNYR